MNNVSLLIGAGFSRPKGYPVVTKLNSDILALDQLNCFIDGVGHLHIAPINEDDQNYYSAYYYDKLFFIEATKFYNEYIGPFDYEKFYDFLFNNKGDAGRDSIFQQFCDNFIGQHTGNNTTDIINLIGRSITTLTQAVEIYIVDRNYHQYYPPAHISKPLQDYDGFLTTLEAAGNRMPVNIHSLNHDLFFESLADSDYLNNDFSDGFTEIETPFSGIPHTGGAKVPLQYFNNVFDKRFNFFKLHGSLDYYPFHVNQDIALGAVVDSYIKIKYGINAMELYKNIDGNDKRDWINYTPRFLSGTTTKILSYSDPIFFNTIFQRFKENISSAKILLVIGYSCSDEEINNIMYKNLQKDCKVYITATNPSIDQQIFIETTSATVINKYVQTLLPEDIGL